MSPPWAVLERSDAPGRLVGAMPDHRGRRLACVAEPLSSALVLGSTQDATFADRAGLAAAGVALERRRSGGGAVFVAPGHQLWLDVFVPAGDHLLTEDVGRSAWWLGEVWADALAAAGVARASEIAVHRGAAVTSRWSRVACFAGIGAGEVTVRGRKLVGISQRRDRSGAWLHSMAPVVLDPAQLARLLAIDAIERVALAAHLERSVAVLSELSSLVAAGLLSCLDAATL